MDMFKTIVLFILEGLFVLCFVLLVSPWIYHLLEGLQVLGVTQGFVDLYINYMDKVLSL